MLHVRAIEADVTPAPEKDKPLSVPVEAILQGSLQPKYRG